MRRRHIRTAFFDELALGRLPSFRRSYAAALGLIVASGVALGATHVGRGAFDGAVTSLARAQPGWLVTAAVSFGVALLASAAAWRAGLEACGGSASFSQVWARYAVGSLVNALAPAHLGGAVRLALLSHTLPGEDRLWRAGGVGASVAAARTLALSALVVAAAAVGGVPLWPAPLLAVTVLVLVGLGIRFGTRTTGRIGALLEIFRSAARSPRAGGVLLAWTACSFAARIVAAVAIAMALGVSSPLLVALVLLAAMALSGALPLTPGNFGAGAGAATLALHGAGVGLGSALALGVAFQAVETFAGMVLGLVGAAVLATPGTRIRRWSLAAAGAGVVVVAAALGIATIDLV
ncbi:MAG TPA: lysylphosphatidylglycerol synthase domain-containing protein [Gaiellaceae bacterium]|nr:lysylphosphatidylglycerol synthase domain-containing protein [Gaiellaceae bacterium]